MAAPGLRERPARQELAHTLKPKARLVLHDSRAPSRRRGTKTQRQRTAGPSERRPIGTGGGGAGAGGARSGQLPGLLRKLSPGPAGPAGTPRLARLTAGHPEPSARRSRPGDPQASLRPGLGQRPARPRPAALAAARLLTLRHLQHLDLLLRGRPHLLHRGQNAGERVLSASFSPWATGPGSPEAAPASAAAILPRAARPPRRRRTLPRAANPQSRACAEGRRGAGADGSAGRGRGRRPPRTAPPAAGTRAAPPRGNPARARKSGGQRPVRSGRWNAALTSAGTDFLRCDSTSEEGRMRICGQGFGERSGSAPTSNQPLLPPHKRVFLSQTRESKVGGKNLRRLAGVVGFSRGWSSLKDWARRLPWERAFLPE